MTVYCSPARRCGDGAPIHRASRERAMHGQHHAPTDMSNEDRVMVTPETLRTEQIDSAFQAGKIDWATHHVARMDPALASGSDVDAILFARSQVCRMLNKQSGQRISTARTGGAS